MYLIIIIGAGNIGSRHLQAFAPTTQKTKIIVIDPFQASLDVCKTRWNEVSKSNNTVEVVFQNDYLSVSKDVDLAIISTNSEHRYEALEDLTTHCNCKNILLEKFLFSDEEEYAKATKLLEKQKTNTYVNLVRRTFEVYQYVFKELVSQKGPITMQVVGNNWGMASNSIHFIDLFCYFAGETITKCDFINPTSTQILNSKRAGYIEFIGSISAETSSRSKLTVACNEGEYDKINIVIEKGDLKILVEEKGDRILVEHSNIKREFLYPFQSQLTLRYFEEFIQGKPSLTPYHKSVSAHLVFLHAVKKLLAQVNYKQTWKIT